MSNAAKCELFKSGFPHMALNFTAKVVASHQTSVPQSTFWQRSRSLLMYTQANVFNFVSKSIKGDLVRCANVFFFSKLNQNSLSHVFGIASSPVSCLITCEREETWSSCLSCFMLVRQNNWVSNIWYLILNHLSRELTPQKWHASICSWEIWFHTIIRG